MSILYSSVLAADGQYSDLVDCRALYGVTKLRVTVDRGSARVYCGANPDALAVLQDCQVGVTDVRLPMLPYVLVARQSGNSSAIKIEIFGPEASELPLTTSTYSALGYENLRRTVAANGAANAATAWAAGVTPLIGERRRLSSGQLIVCGTSGATGATEPTYTDAEIVDNACRWWPDGMSNYLPGASATTMSLATAQTNPSSVAYPLDSVELGQYSAPNIFEVVANRTSAWSHLTGESIDFVGAGAGRQCHTRTLEFMVPAGCPTLQFRVFCPVPNALNSMMQVWLGGILAHENYIVAPTGSTRWVQFSLPDTGLPTRVFVIAGGMLNFGHVVTPLGYQVYRVPSASSRALFFSDSWGDTDPTSGGVSLAQPLADLAVVLPRKLGYWHTTVCAQGGTSYSIASGSRLGVQALIATNVWENFAPDAVFFCHGFNAILGSVSAEVEGTAAQASWRAARSLFPAARFTVVLPWFVRGGYEAATLSMRNTLQRQFFLWGDPNARLYDPITGAGFAGNGTQILPADGALVSAADISVDNAHATPAGRRRIVDRMAAKLIALGS